MVNDESGGEYLTPPEIRFFPKIGFLFLKNRNYEGQPQGLPFVRIFSELVKRILL